jgi:MFS family permease
VGVILWGLHMGMTQGMLAAMIADVSPADLRGTAYGFFNLACGVALLIASMLAGIVWEQFGASFTFYVGATCGAFAIALVAFKEGQVSRD